MQTNILTIYVIFSPVYIIINVTCIRGLQTNFKNRHN